MGNQSSQVKRSSGLQRSPSGQLFFKGHPVRCCRTCQQIIRDMATAGESELLGLLCLFDGEHTSKGRFKAELINLVNERSLLDILFQFYAGPIFISLPQGNSSSPHIKALSWDNNLAAFAVSKNYPIIIWDISKGRQVSFLKSAGPQIEEIGALAFSSNGKQIVAVTSSTRLIGNIFDNVWSGPIATVPSSTIITWDITTGVPIRVFPCEQKLSHVTFSPDCKYFISHDSSVVGKPRVIWDTSTGIPVRDLEHPQILTMTFSPDSKKIISSDCKGQIIIWDTISGQRLQILEKHQDSSRVNEGATGIALSPDGSKAASASPELVIIWEVATGKPIFILGESNNPESANYSEPWKYNLNFCKISIRQMAFSADGRKVIILADNHKLTIVDVASGEYQQSDLSMEDGLKLQSYALSPDASQLIIVYSNRSPGIPLAQHRDKISILLL